MRYANFELNAGAPVSGSSGTPNANLYFWLPLLAGPQQDPMVEVVGGNLLQFNQAGLYLVTANLTCDITVPVDAAPQHGEVTGALAFDPGGIGV